MVYEGHVLLETVTWWDMRQAHSSGRHGQRRRTDGWLNVCLSLMLEAFPDAVACDLHCVLWRQDTITPVSNRASREAAAAADSVWFENLCRPRVVCLLP